MTKRIFRSIVLVAAAVLLCTVIIIMSAFYTYFNRTQLDRLSAQTELAAQGVEHEGVSFFEGLELEDYRFTLVAADGTVLYDSRADIAEMENHLDREEIREALQTGVGESGRTSDTLAQRTLYSARRLSDGSVIRVSITQHTILTLTLGMVQPMLIVLLVAIVLSIWLAFRLSKRVMEPMNNLNLEKPLENDLYSELAPLLNRIDRQQRRIEAQTREVERRREEFEAITSSMSEGLVLLNESGTVLSLNPAAAKLFSTDESCIGSSFLKMDRSIELQHAFERALSEGSGELTLTRNDRKYRIEMNRIDTEKELSGVVLLSFDVTDKQLLERQRREFTANVSHELKTPLQSIMGSAELVENGLVKDGDLPAFMGRIRGEAQRLVSLIDDIIRLSQLDEGGELPIETADIYSIAEEVLQSLAQAAGKRNIDLRLDGESCKVSGVRRLLYEIVYNLVDNAIRYNREGGSVAVSVQNEGSNAVLRVSDTGVGIPKDQQERVFERFYRVDKSHSKETGGTGLGLSIVKHAAQLHHAKVSLESAENSGTIVTVTF
ncbi:MAG: ATP-binding protein [Clostridia bacterium]|nr:ATP-binding protein [Clostridia bacterium]